MFQNQKRRSKLIIKAVVSAAAAATAPVFNQPAKIAAIAGLAGFVLRLFRSREPLPYLVNTHPVNTPPSGCRKGAARIRQGLSKAVRRKVVARPCPPFNPLNPASVAVETKGGFHRG